MSMPFAQTSTAFVVRRNPSKILAVSPENARKRRRFRLTLDAVCATISMGKSFQLHFFTPGLPNSAWEFSRL